MVRNEVKRRPLIKFNAAGALWSCPGKPRPRHIPEFIIVTGHKQRHRGNMGINGFYQRFDQDFHGRPVYQKIMERRQVKKSLVTEASQRCGSTFGWKETATPRSDGHGMLLRTGGVRLIKVG
eukprot:Skav226162  [mRNA]  locus=scaffold2279:64563:71108:+ [translate_table: standard]